MKYLLMAILFSFVSSTYADDINPRYLQLTEFYQKMSTDQLHTQRNRIGDEIGILLMKRRILRELEGDPFAADRLQGLVEVQRGHVFRRIPDRDNAAFAYYMDKIGWPLDKMLMMTRVFKKDENAYYVMAQKMNLNDIKQREQDIIDETNDKVIQAHVVLDELCRRHSISFPSLLCSDSLMKNPLAQPK